MSDLQSPERLYQHSIAALVPFFVDGPAGDVQNARVAAGAILTDYKPANPREMQLATQIIALSWAALACLRAAVAAKNLSVDQMLDLQDNAIGLDRASQKMTKMLDARRKDRTQNPAGMTMENTKWDEGVFQLTINQALDKLNDANTKLAAYMQSLAPAVVPPPPPPAPAVKKTKMPFLFGEQMTPAVLARRAKQ